MLIVEFTDDINTMTFFVFQAARKMFLETIKSGYAIAVNLKKFDDSTTRFLNDKMKVILVEK
jgi:hypothetical protein